MSQSQRRLVLVHGLWDKPNVFKKLTTSLQGYGLEIFAPSLSHNGGRTSLKVLAESLDQKISNRFGRQCNIDILGFSMGGIVSRIWLQVLGGSHRAKRFFSIGSPHKGTFTAQLVPSFFFEGIAEMKRESKLLIDLNKDHSILKQVNCTSFYCKWDLMVFPGWQAVLPVGNQIILPVLTHKGLIQNSRSLRILSNFITCDYRSSLNVAARP